MNFPILLLLLHCFPNKSHVQYNCSISSAWEIQEPMNMERMALVSVSRKVSDMIAFSNLQKSPGSLLLKEDIRVLYSQEEHAPKCEV